MCWEDDAAGDALHHEVVVGDAGSWPAAAEHDDDDPYTVGAPVLDRARQVYRAVQR